MASYPTEEEWRAAVASDLASFLTPRWVPVSSAQIAVRALRALVLNSSYSDLAASSLADALHARRGQFVGAGGLGYDNTLAAGVVRSLLGDMTGDDCVNLDGALRALASMGQWSLMAEIAEISACPDGPVSGAVFDGTIQGHLWRAEYLQLAYCGWEAAGADGRRRVVRSELELLLADLQ